MRLYSYIIARDYGFAPNPFYGMCTLATCKPEIRKHCAVGDWVMGTGSSSQEQRPGHLVYIMCVSETMPFDDYWEDPRFLLKRPNLRGSLKQAFGDNIYHRSGDAWVQLPSHHSLHDGHANPVNVERDTRVNRVLVANRFVYWGANAPKIPARFRRCHDICTTTQGHKCRFPDSLIKSFLNWALSYTTDEGLQGAPPHRWIPKGKL